MGLHATSQGMDVKLGKNSMSNRAIETVLASVRHPPLRRPSLPFPFRPRISPSRIFHPTQHFGILKEAMHEFTPAHSSYGIRQFICVKFAFRVSCLMRTANLEAFYSKWIARSPNWRQRQGTVGELEERLSDPHRVMKD
jgi:hypothetical protein